MELRRKVASGGLAYAQILENRRTASAIGSPAQKMCMTTPMTVILKENGNFMAPDNGTTMRFMKK
ncbi:MAG: hypothetical protein LAO30_00325 [Acidobacteriia bacterium]|nr:hypothetical protein [Terriglobia bacterium]